MPAPLHRVARRRLPHAIRLVGWVLLSCMPVVPAAAAARAGELVIDIVDERTSRPLPARVYVRGADGSWHFARSADPAGSAVPYEKRNWINADSVEAHTTVSAHPAVADLPAGRYTVTVERGKEYFPFTTEVEVAADPVTVRVPLRRWVDMAARGWYSGETHLHRTVEQLRNVALAEDLNVSFPLSYWVTEAFTPPAAGDKNVAGEVPDGLVTVDATHVIWPRNTEYEFFTVGGRQHTLGALFVLNHRVPLLDGGPPMGPIARAAVAGGALLDTDKLDWPFAASLPHTTGAQLYELINNHVWRTEFAFRQWSSPAPPHMQPPYGGRGGGEREWVHYTLGMYYTLLNAGLRAQPSAGTASGVHPVPAGFGRVYVYLPDGFGYDAWLGGLRAGRSFVTNGPMLFATVDGQQPGATLPKGPAAGPLRVAGSVLSEAPLAFVEVVRDGRPALTFMPHNERTAEGAYESTFAGELPAGDSGWLAVRCWEDRPGGRFRFAHTAPWHVEVPGRPPRPWAEDKAYLVARVSAEIERSKGVLPADAIAEYEAALAAYRALEVRDDAAEVREQARAPRDDADLKAWLENMVWDHGFSPAEVRLATGLSEAAVNDALRRWDISAATRPAADPPGGPVRVRPYPGGRHPRRGFLDGARAPQRDTKVSVFTPWDPASYVVVDVPEAIFSNLGLLYLAHTHVPTAWEQRGTTLEPTEWRRGADGTLTSERVLPNGARFGATVTPAGPDAVRMGLWLHNGTDRPLTGLRVQNCVMLKAAAGFDAQTSANKRLSAPFAAVGSEDGGRWIITAWSDVERTWANAPVPCMHADPRFPDCPPGETRRLNGWLSFYEGREVDAELARLRAANVVAPD